MAEESFLFDSLFKGVLNRTMTVGLLDGFAAEVASSESADGFKKKFIASYNTTH